MRLVIRIQGVQPENQSFLALPDSQACEARPELRYSDGKKIISREGKVREFEDGYESEIKFTRVPPDGTEATLFIPCLFGSAESGIPPEFWSIPFHLSLPPENTDFDVILLPTQTPLPLPPEPETLPTTLPPMPAPSTTPAQLNPISVLEAIDTGTSYVFIGAFAPPVSAAGETSIYTISDYLLRDASDRTIEWQPAIGLDLTPYVLSAPGKNVWAIEFTQDFVPPLQITYQTQRLVSPDKDEKVSFEFDAGENPQAGQVWELDRDIKLAGHKVTLTEITAGASSYTFHFQTNDDLVESVGMHDQNAIRIEGYRHENFAGRFGIGSWSLTKIYAQLPRGKLTISISGIFLFDEIEDWTIDWRP
jgi:hypothetical protein